MRPFGSLTMFLLVFAAISAGSTITYSGALVQFTVPSTGVYTIDAYGAQGGTGSVALGGLGAEIGGDFDLTAGEVLQILVGGMGFGGTGVSVGPVGGGGGGGTYVI